MKNKSLSAKRKRLAANAQLCIDMTWNSWMKVPLIVFMICSCVLALVVSFLVPQDAGYYVSHRTGRRRWREGRSDRLESVLESLGLGAWRGDMPYAAIGGVVVTAAIIAMTVLMFKGRKLQPNFGAAVSQLQPVVADRSASAVPESAQWSRLAGTWHVNTDIVKYSYYQSLGCLAGLQMEERWTGRKTDGSHVQDISTFSAVCRTGDVSGTLKLANRTLSEAVIEIGMSMLTTDGVNRKGLNERRREALKTDRHPRAVFRLAVPVPLPPQSTDGAVLRLDAVGDLTLAGVTRRVSFRLQTCLVGDVLAVFGSSKTAFIEHGIQYVEFADDNIRSVAETWDIEPDSLKKDGPNGTIELQLFLTR